jgi:cell pole-organizing protein PopZ
MEQLKPMLSTWLDEHLPAIVERIVEREVRYLSRRLESDDRA